MNWIDENYLNTKTTPKRKNPNTKFTNSNSGF